jgi:hypothetical protein
MRGLPPRKRSPGVSEGLAAHAAAWFPNKPHRHYFTTISLTQRKNGYCLLRISQTQCMAKSYGNARVAEETKTNPAATKIITRVAATRTGPSFAVCGGRGLISFGPFAGILMMPPRVLRKDRSGRLNTFLTTSRHRIQGWLGTILEWSTMHEYEYIVLGRDRRPLLVVAQAHLNDSTAIRSAMSFARGLEFEVWRDIDCIHSALESHDSPVVST